MPGKIMTALTRIEADNLWSTGRLLDAKRIYSDLIASSPYMTLNTRANLEARIKLLQKEIDRPVSDGNAGDIARDIDDAIKKLQQALAKDRSIEDLRKSAKNFFGKGLYADALECLKALVRQNAADEFCVRTTAESIIRQYSIEDIPVAVDLFLVEAFHNAEKAALFKMMLAEKMDQIGYAGQSRVLQRHDDRFTTY